MILLNKSDLLDTNLDVHLPLSASGSSVQDEEEYKTDKQSSSSTTGKSEMSGGDGNNFLFKFNKIYSHI